MGIRDLLSLYKALITKENISNFRGKTCAIDMMVWLYKGMYAVNNNPNCKDVVSFVDIINKISASLVAESMEYDSFERIIMSRINNNIISFKKL